jgi:hypothetical protein
METAMLRSFRMLLAAALCTAAGAGCTDFLTANSASRDPNNPSNATTDQLLTAVQASQFTEQEGFPALLVCLWMQQCQGVGGRFVQIKSQYQYTEQDTRSDFSAIYSGGGLVDLKEVQRRAGAAGDSVYKGIAKVWEAYVIGTAADQYGDIPYRQAAGDVATPAFDPQLQVYDDLQLKLDTAIAELAGPGPGPGVVDLVYGGDPALWTEAAYTLKARLYLHTVEVRGSGEYQKAIDAALQGISTPAHDFRTFHTSATFERNIWYQFNVNSGFGEDAVAGKLLVDLMNARSDPRLPEYFGAASPGPGYGGVDVDLNVSPNGISLLEGTRNDPLYRQPLITNDENLLILAEANVVLSGAGAAQPYLDQERDNHQIAHAPATLATIMEDKYIALFQNVEVWNDYKRTCLPARTPFVNPTFAGEIPGRFYYGEFERATNPNTPSVTDQLANGGVAGGRPGVGGFRNPNDPNPCP